MNFYTTSHRLFWQLWNVFARYLPCCFKYNLATWKKKEKTTYSISKTSKMYLLHFILHDFWIILQKMKFYCQQQYIQLLTIISDKFIYMTSAFKVTSLCWKNWTQKKTTWFDSVIWCKRHHSITLLVFQKIILMGTTIFIGK